MLRTESPMRLRVLGCAGGFPAVDNPNSGYLLEEGKTRIWIDAGTGSFAALQPHAADYERIDALVLSHLHPDHCADVYPLHVALQYEKQARMRLFGPPGTLEALGGLIEGGAANLATIDPEVSLCEARRTAGEVPVRLARPAEVYSVRG
jgi:ribonuclease BN (tRNA processing enzyme)